MQTGTQLLQQPYVHHRYTCCNPGHMSTDLAGPFRSKQPSVNLADFGEAYKRPVWFHWDSLEKQRTHVEKKKVLMQKNEKLFQSKDAVSIQSETIEERPRVLMLWIFTLLTCLGSPCKNMATAGQQRRNDRLWILLLKLEDKLWKSQNQIWRWWITCGAESSKRFQKWVLVFNILGGIGIKSMNVALSTPDCTTRSV